MANTISNFDDVIDSRDVIARIEELEGEREALQDNFDEAESAFDDAESDLEDCDDTSHGYRDCLETALELAETARDEALEALQDWDNGSDADELRILKALADEASGYAADWQYGETLIRDSYFRDYAMELADDIGAVPRDLAWPATCIDWDQAALELQYDYTAVDFDGVTYWVR